MTDWNKIAVHISTVTGSDFKPQRPSTVGGGCINSSVLLSDGEQRYFVKLNDLQMLNMFEAEQAGLAALAATDTLRIPQPICSGTAGGDAYLAMEYIPLSGGGDSEAAGRLLASLHQNTHEQFGWERDNIIGATHQPNRLTDDWIDFWRSQRLGFQLELAAKNGYRGELQHRGELLLEQFPALIDHQPVASLIHGDLWGGNLAYDSNGQPVIFDPAVYYADREAELAMTELFGGFNNRFYDAYNEVWPLDSGYRQRKTLYNLYHIINHLNLFGGSYQSQALGMINRLLAELGG
ncbi:MAG: fructosamine kinase family protein [Candidatus Sedimenticola sp. (ex Thyasira tokunagai)]